MPVIVNSSAIPRASPPADNVPKARLNPLLRVAPNIYDSRWLVTLALIYLDRERTKSLNLGQGSQKTYSFDIKLWS